MIQVKRWSYLCHYAFGVGMEEVGEGGGEGVRGAVRFCGCWGGKKAVKVT